MAQPFSYILNVPNPAEAVTSGLQQGVQLASMMERTDALAAQRRQTELENQALQVKAQREAAQRAALDAFYAKPSAERTAADYEAISATLPKEMAENVRASFDAKTKEEQRQDLLFGSQVLSALRLKDTGTASQMLQERAKAYETSGMKAQAQAMQNLADMTLIDPERAELALGPTIAVVPGGKDFIDNLAKQQATQFEAQLQPAKIAKAVAEGKTAEIVAATEQKMRDAEIALKGAQTTSAKASAGASYASAKKTLREIQRIDALEPGEVRKLAAEAGKLEAEAAAKRGEGGAQGALAAGQRVLDTVALLRGPKGDFGVLKDIAGPVKSKLPTFADASADAERAIETVQSQVFLSQVNQMKGLGALTEKEGDRLVASIANLSLNQSADRLQRNLEYIENTMKTAMEKARALGAESKPAAAKPSPVALPSGFKYTVEGE